MARDVVTVIVAAGGEADGEAAGFFIAGGVGGGDAAGDGGVLGQGLRDDVDGRRIVGQGDARRVAVGAGEGTCIGDHQVDRWQAVARVDVVGTGLGQLDATVGQGVVTVIVAAGGEADGEAAGFFIAGGVGGGDAAGDGGVLGQGLRDDVDGRRIVGQGDARRVAVGAGEGTCIGDHQVDRWAGCCPR